jgi:hypothetical protein
MDDYTKVTTREFLSGTNRIPAKRAIGKITRRALRRQRGAKSAIKQRQESWKKTYSGITSNSLVAWIKNFNAEYTVPKISLESVVEKEAPEAKQETALSTKSNQEQYCIGFLGSACVVKEARKVVGLRTLVVMSNFIFFAAQRLG